MVVNVKKQRVAVPQHLDLVAAPNPRLNRFFDLFKKHNEVTGSAIGLSDRARSDRRLIAVVPMTMAGCDRVFLGS